MNKLCILDGYYHFFRAYHTPITPLVTQTGITTTLPFIFTKVLFDVLSTVNPTHLVVALDSPRSQLIRKQIYPEYKENRVIKKDDSFFDQIKLCFDILSAANIPQIKVAEYEADDVIATVVHKYASDFEEIVVVSNDKDLYCLTGYDNLKLYDPYEIRYTINKYLYHRFEVDPVDFSVVLALCGDTSDNIPHIKGLGIKTACWFMRTAPVSLKDKLLVLLEENKIPEAVDILCEIIQQESLTTTSKVVKQIAKDVLVNKELLARNLLLTKLSKNLNLGDFKLEDAKVDKFTIKNLKSLFGQLEFNKYLPLLENYN